MVCETCKKELLDWLATLKDETAFNEWQVRKSTIIEKLMNE